MRFAPRIQQFTLTSTILTTTIVPATESVIIWGIVIHNNDGSNRVYNFAQEDGTPIFNVGTGSAQTSKSVIIDIPFILDNGLKVTILSATATLNITVLMSNVGA